MASKLDDFRVLGWAIRAVLDGHGSRMSKALCEQFGVTRMTASRVLRRLVDDGWLKSSGSTRPVYTLGANRRCVKRYTLPGVEESMAWLHDFAPVFDTLPANLAAIAEYGFTELVNNANDHSDGTFVTVLMTANDGMLTLVVMDDGIGIFEKITKALNLPDRRLAILELSKGKLTTDPTRHSGQGIFFTSRMFDQFQIEANDLHYDHDIRDADDWLLEMERQETGTLLYMRISLDSKRTLREIFDDYSSGDDYGFAKTVVPVRLAIIGNENLVSRSQAKRLVSRFEGFKTVLLDFTEVDDIGQAFADQIFRVFALAHPNIEIIPINVTPAVQQMINRAVTANLFVFPDAETPKK
jgi:anti-sigma regulatory factor (Ser/Thr protein kinase)/anti-anti-sigma regulatory factor